MAQRALYRRMARSGLADLRNEAARRVVFNVGTTLKHSRRLFYSRPNEMRTLSSPAGMVFSL